MLCIWMVGIRWHCIMRTLEHTDVTKLDNGTESSQRSQLKHKSNDFDVRFADAKRFVISV